MTGLLDGSVEAAAGLAVWGADAVPGAARVRGALLAEDVPRRLAAKDPTLWGAAARPEASIRLGWVDTAARSRGLLGQLAELSEELSDLDRVVLAGMGGSSLAPEVISLTLGRPLTVLDSTDPQQVRAALADRLERTVVVVSSKSGTTVETDSQRRAFLRAMLDAGLTRAEAARHFVMVTDPGTPLVETAAGMGAVAVLADPEVGGRYSALTAFGLVPAALLGVDVVDLLDSAGALAGSLAGAIDNPALALGAALGAAADPAGARLPRSTVALVEDGTGIVGLGAWAEQLLAESTGKDGRGLLPVVAETPAATGATGAGVLTVTVGGSLPAGAVPGGGVRPHVAVNGPLGAQFLAWEYATAVAGRVLGINPFDQPNVTESKDNTTALLARGLPPTWPDAVDGPVEIHGTRARTLRDALAGLVAGVGGGYLSVLTYLDRAGDAPAAGLRPLLAGATARPVTFGWGPRYLHSTGQYHKGGPQDGSFLLITGAVMDDLPVPGRPYTFGQLQAAQAAGDRQALAGRGRPVLWLHLRDRADGLARVLSAAGGLVR